MSTRPLKRKTFIVFTEKKKKLHFQLNDKPMEIIKEESETIVTPINPSAELKEQESILLACKCHYCTSDLYEAVRDEQNPLHIDVSKCYDANFYMDQGDSPIWIPSESL